MSKLLNYSLVLIVFVAVIHENIALRTRNSFQSAVNICNRQCRFPIPPLPPSRRNGVEKCLILLDHDSVLITLCEGSCLQKMQDQGLGNADICDCRSKNCISTSSSSTTTTSAPTSSPITSSPASSSPGSTSPASSSPGSTSPASSSPGSSSPATVR